MAYLFKFNSRTTIRQLKKQSEVDQAQYMQANKVIFTVPIKGGRFEVNLLSMAKKPVYWEDKKPSEVRRCLWFYKENNQQRFVPYKEEYSVSRSIF